MSKADEQAKLTATFVNGLAISMVALGFIAPLVAFSYSTGTLPVVTVLVLGMGWLIAAAVIDLMARRFLRDLDL